MRSWNTQPQPSSGMARRVSAMVKVDDRLTSLTRIFVANSDLVDPFFTPGIRFEVVSSNKLPAELELHYPLSLDNQESESTPFYRLHDRDSYRRSGRYIGYQSRSSAALAVVLSPRHLEISWKTSPWHLILKAL